MMDYQSDPSSYERQYVAAKDRYENVSYRQFGASGLKVSPITLGTWQNFGELEPREVVRSLYLTAFDHGINSFDFGNNYGRPPGSAEVLFGSFITGELARYRDELIVTTKAGYEMWPGPNGRGSSLKYLISSLDQSLLRLKLDYVDIFYSHCFDPDTPIEEVADALDFIRRSGRALYVGISSYPHKQTVEICNALKERGTQLLALQTNYSIFSQWPEKSILGLCHQYGIGFAAFSPLAQGLLTPKYVSGKAMDSRGMQKNTSVYVNDWELARKALRGLSKIAAERGQSLSQMALSWTLRCSVVATTVMGARTPEQIIENLKLDLSFTEEEKCAILELGNGIDVDLWKKSRMSVDNSE
ncbi:aldo/keto reductase [Alphaproteobacteria bacterium]|nr:aldo/keto reductase [Alphaproteobacteria bacterium]